MLAIPLALLAGVAAYNYKQTPTLSFDSMDSEKLYLKTGSLFHTYRKEIGYKSGFWVVLCGFRGKPARHSILKPATDSGANRPPIPEANRPLFVGRAEWVAGFPECVARLP